LSSGNQFTSIRLDENRDTLIVGANGSGKSTVLDALTFSLFGKPFRKVTKSQLLNSTNERDAKVEIEFDIGDVPYKVVRGIKPNIFEIYRHGKKTNEDCSANEQQKTLENQILKLNYKSFTQIVILGSASFIPFMQLSAPHRREVIEDLLDIKVFTMMSDILKVQIKESRDALRVLELKKESVADKIVMQKRFIKSIEDSGNDSIATKREEIQNCDQETVEYQRSVEELISKVNEKQKEVEEYITATDTLKKLSKFKVKLQTKKQNSNQELDFFTENTVCPTCTQDIEDKFRVNRIDELRQVLVKHQASIDEITSAIEAEEEREKNLVKLQRETTTLSNEISQFNIRIANNNKRRGTLETEIQNIADKIENRDTEDEKLTDYKNQLKDILLRLEETQDDFDYLSEGNQLLKDDGVKKRIIRKYLPLINKQVNDYLQRMDFYVNFMLDEDFNETVQTPVHEKFSYASFSEGEKMRIDLALLFTWREIARMKNSVVTNLLIMDEVFDSSLDEFGTEYFLKIVRYIITDANVFIISHKQDLYDKFNHCLEFTKDKGFSKLKS
jgi:DNA repair exonuclease SbcCD ATPase subunit